MAAAPTPYDSAQSMNKDSCMVAVDKTEKQQRNK